MSVDHPQHELALQQGKDEGQVAGRMVGFYEGRRLGQTKGVDYGMEVGFALGLLRAVQRLQHRQIDETTDITDTTIDTTTTLSSSSIIENNSKCNGDLNRSTRKMNHHPATTTLIGNDRIQKSVDELATAIGNFPNTAEQILLLMKTTAGPESVNEDGNPNRDCVVNDDDTTAAVESQKRPSSQPAVSSSSHPSSSSSSSSMSPPNFDLREQLQRIRARSKVLTAKLGIPHHSLSIVMQEYIDETSSSTSIPSLQSTTTTSRTDNEANNVSASGRKVSKAGPPSLLRTAEW